jgi:hypothetical protein
MVKELEHIDIDDAPDLVRLAEAVHASGTPRILSRGNEDLAMIVPLERYEAGKAVTPPKPVGRRERRFSKNDSLWRIVGLVTSDGPGDVSRNKNKYLADAYAAESAREE